ncbi:MULTISPECIES: DUF2523 family protein [unclassified Comamonas]|jgi:Protein of unknown function (DUF2523)|uniref:DUF2523 family protein n=1 Tax=unclassified Comamonas TaxID=2638500 RepID=UPI001EFB7913|nr:DUF2523 family protein [Comamonas sp. B21-038]ULR90839.1 DUF2523 domain-containing protein [Comamonas sp. B21-038]
MAAILKTLQAIWKWFGDLAGEQFQKLWDLLTDVVCWALDGILGLVVSAVSAVDLSGLDSYSNSVGEVPAEILNVMQMAGLGTASQIIIAAIGIRLVLQLIPFTRLGS